MKRIYFSLMTIAVLLFTACTSYIETGKNTDTPIGTGVLETTITFDSGLNDGNVKTAGSTAIPTTTWANVKQIQLFLYNATSGQVAYSQIIAGSDIPTGLIASKQFIWTNVPTGTYRLALVANALSSSDNVATWVDQNQQVFTMTNVLGKNFTTTAVTPAANSGLQIDLKPATLPTVPGSWGAVTGYAPPAEIFTAYSENVTISLGQTTTISQALGLKREISMLRARLNIKGIPVQNPSSIKANFDNGANNFIAVRRLPVGFGLKTGTFEGGVFNTSDNNRILVASSGAGTFKNSDPAPGDGYTPTQIITPGTNPDYSLWHDIRVLPNASASQIANPDPVIQAGRTYFIIVCARADAGYVYADGQTIAAAGDPIYWGATINGEFTKNTIREANLIFKTAGEPEIPIPTDIGTLDILIGLPEAWKTVIESSEAEL